MTRHHHRRRRGNQENVASSSDSDSSGDEQIHSPRRDLRRLIREKERELDEINQYRSKSIASLAAAKATEAEELKSKLVQIRTDFAYNLKLLEERDAELDRYDNLFSRMSLLAKERDEEIVCLKNTVEQQSEKATKMTQQFQTKSEEFDRQIKMREDEYAEKTSQTISKYEAQLLFHQRQHEIAIDEISQRHQKQLVQQKSEFISLRDGLQHQVQDLTLQLQTFQLTAEEGAVLSHTILAERDTQIRILESDNAKLVELKHALLLQYEEKVGSVLSSLHALELQFSEQRLAYEARYAQQFQEREAAHANRLKELEDSNHSKDLELQNLIKERDNLDRKLQSLTSQFENERCVLDNERGQTQQALQDARFFEDKCSELKRIIDERNDHVAILKDAVRDMNAEMRAEQVSWQTSQAAVDKDLYVKLSKAEERIESVIGTLARNSGENDVVSQAETLSELQSGLLSIKRDLRSRHSSASVSSATSRQPSLGHLPRAEQILANIPELATMPSVSRMRRSSTIVRPMDVQILQSPSNLIVDGMQNPGSASSRVTRDRLSFEQIVEMDGPDNLTDDNQSDKADSEHSSSLSSTRNLHSLNSSLGGHDGSLGANGFATMDTVLEDVDDDANGSGVSSELVSIHPRHHSQSFSGRPANKDRHCRSQISEVEEIVLSDGDENHLECVAETMQPSTDHRGEISRQSSTHSVVDSDANLPEHGHNRQILKGVPLATGMKEEISTPNSGSYDKVDRSSTLSSRAVSSTDVPAPNRATCSVAIQTDPCEDKMEQKNLVLQGRIDELQDEKRVAQQLILVLKQDATQRRATPPLVSEGAAERNILRHENERLQHDLEKLNIDLAVLQDQKQDSVQSTMKLESEMAQMKSDMNLMSGKLKQKHSGSEDADLKWKCKLASQELDSLHSRVRSLEQENSALQQSLSSAREYRTPLELHPSADLQQVLSELHELRQHQDDGSRRDETGALREQNDKLRQIVNDMKIELQSISRMQAATSSEIELLKEINQDQSSRIQVLTGTVGEGKLFSVDEETSLLRQQIEKLNKSLLECHDRVISAERELLQEKHSLREKTMKLEAEHERVKSELYRANHYIQSLQQEPCDRSFSQERSVFQAHISSLNQQIKVLDQRLIAATILNDQRLDEVHMIEAKFDTLREQNDQQQRMIQVLKTSQSRTDAGGSDQFQTHSQKAFENMRSENSELRKGLDAARADLETLASEKDKLMEISNMLKANVSKLNIDQPVTEIPLSLIDATGDLTQIYNSKIANVERTLRDLLRQNQVLRAQINNLSKMGRLELGLHRHPGASEYCTDPVCQLRLVHSYGTALVSRGSAEAQILNRLDQLDRDVQQSLKHGTAKPLIDDLQRTVVQEEPVDTVPQHQARAESRVRHRLKQELGSLAEVESKDQLLESARRSFRVARQSALYTQGHAVDIQPGHEALNAGFKAAAPSINSSRHPISRADRLARDHTKRSLLLKQRQAIRNYNDHD